MTAPESPAEPLVLLVVSDFICPWCYIGLTEVEQLMQDYDVRVRFAPYLLDPSVPPEGKVREPRNRSSEAASYMEQRASSKGITMSQGRTKTSWSHFALEAAEFAEDHGLAFEYHKRMFKAYFTDLEDIGTIDAVVRIGAEAGLPADELRAALESGEYRQHVDDGVEWARQVGVRSIPTFVFDNEYALVGAQEYPVFQDLLAQIGRKPRASE